MRRLLTASALRWLTAAGAALAFMTTLSVQVVRGDAAPGAPGASQTRVATVVGDITPATTPGATMRLASVGIPALRPEPRLRRHRSRPRPVVAAAPTLVSAPAATPARTPTPVPAPVATPVAVESAPPPAPVSTPKPAPRGPAFDSSG